MSTRAVELAWASGDRPDAPHFEVPVDPALERAVVQALAGHLPHNTSPVVRLRALRETATAAGRYRLDLGEESWFVRISARLGAPEAERAITDYLASHGIPVTAFTVAGLRFDWAGRYYRLDAKPFVDGRHFDGSKTDLVRLSETMAECHAVLRRYPDSGAVRLRAERRCRRLEDARGRLAAALLEQDFSIFAGAKDWATLNRDWLTAATKAVKFDFPQRPNAQVLHGEVHPGNVLFREADGMPVLIDFEESVAAFAPTDWDLAYLVHRFALQDASNPQEAACRMSVTLDAYGTPVTDLVQAMREAAFCLVFFAIAAAVADGTETPISEYEKFHRLERQTQLFDAP